MVHKQLVSSYYIRILFVKFESWYRKYTEYFCPAENVAIVNSVAIFNKKERLLGAHNRFGLSNELKPFCTPAS